jgi:peptidoglycan/LPS O-acetylase OafA/YrhL
VAVSPAGGGGAAGGLALGLAVPFFRQISARWIVVPGQFIGRYSYGIYLTHIFCIWLAFERFHFLLPQMLQLAVLVTGLPVLFYLFLEQPMVQMGKRVAKRYEKDLRHDLASPA